MTPELDRHLARTCWHMVAHRSELAHDRDFVRLEWLLGDLVLYNDKGDVIAFDNVCPHRGARFFLEGQGNAPAVCPYHGWGYRGGKLRIPRPETFPACKLAQVDLNRFHLAWCGDFAFVAIAPASSLPDQLGDLAPILAGISATIDRQRHRDSYTYEAPWRVAVENALEPDHVAMVHPDTLDTLGLQDLHNTVHGPNSMLRATIGAERMARRLRRIRRFFATDVEEPGYTAIFIYPFACLTTTFGYTFAVQNFMPARTGHTHFTSRLFSAHVAPGGEAVTDTFFASVAEMNRTVFAEDHAICRRVDPDFPLEGPNQLLSSSEVAIAHFRRNIEAARRTALLQPC